MHHCVAAAGVRFACCDVDRVRRGGRTRGLRSECSTELDRIAEAPLADQALIDQLIADVQATDEATYTAAAGRYTEVVNRVQTNRSGYVESATLVFYSAQDLQRATQSASPSSTQ